MIDLDYEKSKRMYWGSIFRWLFGYEGTLSIELVCIFILLIEGCSFLINLFVASYFLGGVFDLEIVGGGSFLGGGFLLEGLT